MRKRLAAVQRECWLCLEPLRFDVTDPRDPKFVVIDEEVPVSKGGDPLDESNCNLVCRCCNARKGDRILKKGAFAKGAKAIAKMHTPKPSRKWF